MKKTTTILYIAGLITALSSSMVLAESVEQNVASNTLIPQYGENPNIAHVLAYKTQDKVIGAAHTVGDATSRGVAKIKPSLNRAWENTKNLTARGTQEVKEGSKQAASNVNEKLKDAKQSITAPQKNAPLIEHQSLSQSSNTTQHSTTQASVTTYAIDDL